MARGWPRPKRPAYAACERCRRRSTHVAIALVLGVSAPATAEPIEVGGAIGPRFFSDDAGLGYLDEAPTHPTLTNAITLLGRVSKPLLPWLSPEFELPIAFTTTNAFDVSVAWLAPRAHLRFLFSTESRWRPFLVAGGGALIALSSAPKIYGTDLSGDGYVGIGTDVATGRGFRIRADARLSMSPAAEQTIALEFEAGIGISVPLGASDGATRPAADFAAADDDDDADGDGISASEDLCPRRLEDHDGFEDRDGCPDIDNDLDSVLDDEDKCPNVPEIANGFDDADGCPDAVPPELDTLRGTIEGLVYAEGAVAVVRGARASLRKVSLALGKHQQVRVLLVGHTDDTEAATPTDGGASPEAVALSRRRAAAVRDVLVSLGLDPNQLQVVGKAATEPVSDNSTRRGRAANRRVELRLIGDKR